jgi:hypothetical protein
MIATLGISLIQPLRGWCLPSYITTGFTRGYSHVQPLSGLFFVESQLLEELTQLVGDDKVKVVY